VQILFSTQPPSKYLQLGRYVVHSVLSTTPEALSVQTLSEQGTLVVHLIELPVNVSH